MTESNNVHTPRPEYPRPQFVRPTWLNLNGTWEFAFDDENAGERAGWWKGDRPLPQTICVPFAFQAPLSTIGDRSFHDVMWYRRAVEIPEEWTREDLLLHFGAVDYRAKVWVNGVQVSSHEGGQAPFSAEISAVVRPGTNLVVVRAEDPSTDLTIPRGKQYWCEQSASIFYTRTSGIWQTVWLEPVPVRRIDRIRLTPDLSGPAIAMEIFINRYRPGTRIAVTVRFGPELVAEETFLATELRTFRVIGLSEGDHRFERMWTPENPQLYDVEFKLLDGAGGVLDKVDSYFGMRSVTVRQGKVLLNNLPYAQKLVLDQGYWPESLLTPPSDAAIRRDIELTKAMGFNGVRKHQKVEDPRYLYWADHLGLAVWSEMAAAYHFNDEAMARTTREWIEAVERDYNHPSIVAWVPINESWGVPHLLHQDRERQYLQALYHLLKALDGTRPVSTNDGWEHPETDLLTIHDYSASGDVLRARYSASVDEALRHTPGKRFICLPGFEPAQQPLLISEFGGVAFKKGAVEGWGYSGAVDEPDFIRRYRDLVGALSACPNVAGWCYTQLTDVEQEINGLLTYHREPKVDTETIRQINQGR